MLSWCSGTVRGDMLYGRGATLLNWLTNETERRRAYIRESVIILHIIKYNFLFETHSTISDHMMGVFVIYVRCNK